MKKNIIKSLLAIACLLCSIGVYAHDFKVDGIYYRLLSEENQVAVTYYGDDVYDVPEEYIYTGSVTIPETVTYQDATYSVTEIGDYAFFDCDGLTEVTIPNSVTSIGESAFYGCTGLTGVYITDLSAWCGIDFGNHLANPLWYAHNLYINNELVTSLVIPDDVTSIDYAAFASCSSLNEVTIGSSVTSIGLGVFAYCTGLTEVTIGNSVTSIGENAFAYCSSLKEVTIPNSVTSIDYGAFSYCSGLTEIVIGNSVTEIGDYAFDKCERIKDVYAYPAVPPTIYSNTFTVYTNDNATLHVVKGCKDAYADAKYWKYFLNITDDLTSGVEDIMVDTDNTPAEYYDLNGCRVDHPTHGIYIVKQGDIVKKVVL